MEAMHPIPKICSKTIFFLKCRFHNYLSIHLDSERFSLFTYIQILLPVSLWYLSCENGDSKIKEEHLRWVRDSRSSGGVQGRSFYLHRRGFPPSLLLSLVNGKKDVDLACWSAADSVLAHWAPSYLPLMAKKSAKKKIECLYNELRLIKELCRLKRKTLWCERQRSPQHHWSGQKSF